VGPRELRKLAEDAAEQARKVQALKAVLNASGAALGAGMVGRGALELMRVLSGAKPPQDASPVLPRTLRIPVVQQEAQDVEDKARLGLTPDSDLRRLALQAQRAPAYKYGSLDTLAADLAKQAADDGISGWLAKKLEPVAPGTADVAGMPAPDPRFSAAYIPIGLGAAGLSVFGGWKLVDWLLAKRRKAELAKKLQQSKSEYRAALNEQYAAMLPPAKTASAGIGATMQQLADAWSKCADYTNPFTGAPISVPSLGQLAPQPVSTAANYTEGAMATLMGLLAVGSGIGTYQWTRSRSKAHALEEALRQRRMERAGRPTPPVAVADVVTPEEFAQA
jgi:hypothetical protein